MDKQNKPQQTSDEEVTPAAPAAPLAPLQARSPYRPLSRRKRQEQTVDPPSAVERPFTSSRFDASPTTISAALAKAGVPAEEYVLVWVPGQAGAGDDEVDIEIEEPEAEV